MARLNDLLNFPDGWLESSIDPEVEVRHSGRPLELDYLRRTCLVEVVFLLHNVLHSTKQYRYRKTSVDKGKTEWDKFMILFQGSSQVVRHGRCGV